MDLEALSKLLPWLELVGIGAQVAVTLVAALVTAASVVVIAWQARMTRQSVELTAQALVVAREEAAVNREGILIARHDAERREEQMLHERRAWLDSLQPVLTVEVEEAVQWSLVRPLGIFGDVRPGLDINGEPVVRIDEHSMGDLDRKVGGRIEGVITNDAGARAVCEVFDRDGGFVDRVVVPVGQSEEFRIPVVHSAAEWILRYRAAEGDAEESFFEGTVRFVSTGGRGVVASWPIFMTGSLLVPEGAGSDYWIGGGWGGNLRPTAKVRIPGELIDRQYFFEFTERLALLTDIKGAFTAENLDERSSDARS